MSAFIENPDSTLALPCDRVAKSTYRHRFRRRYKVTIICTFMIFYDDTNPNANPKQSSRRLTWPQSTLTTRNIVLGNFFPDQLRNSQTFSWPSRHFLISQTFPVFQKSGNSGHWKKMRASRHRQVYWRCKARLLSMIDRWVTITSKATCWEEVTLSQSAVS